MDPARVLRALAIRPGEGRLVGGVAVLFALLEGARGFGEVGADSLLLARFGPDALPTVLPFLFIGLGSLSFVVSIVYAVALGRLPRTPLFVSLLAGIAILLVVERIGLAAGMAGLVPVLWLTVFASSTINLTIAWTVGGASFDARQAKRLFPLLTSAAIAGSFVGTLAAGPVALLAGVESIILVQAGLLAVAAVLLGRLPRPRSRPTVLGRRMSVIDDLRMGFDVVMGSPSLRLVALAYVLLAVLMFSVSFPFLIAASRELPDKVALATALGLLSTAITATSFLLSLVVANRLYARLGVTAGALALPIVYLVGFGTWLVQFSFATAAAFRFAQQATQRGISNAAWSAFYNVVPAERRAQALAFTDGVPGQAGTVLSGVLLLAAASLPGLEPVFMLGLVTALVATVVVAAIRRRYADSLLAALRTGLAEQVLEGGPGLPAALDQPDVRGALLAALDDPDQATRRLAVALLRRAGLRPDERRHVGSLLDDPSAGVRGEAAAALADDATDDRPARVVADLLGSVAEVDRVAGLEAARISPGLVESAALAPLVGSSAPAIRAGAIEAMAARADADAALPTEVLLAALDDDHRVVRSAAAAVLKDRPEAGPGLARALTEGSTRVQDAALSAVAGHATGIRGDLLEWAQHRIERAEVLRRAHATIAAVAGASEVGRFLATVIDQRARQAEDRSIAAVLAVGAPAAGGLMRRSLRSTDPDARAQAIEALDSLGDRRLGRALVACLEAATASPTDDPFTTLDRLAQDDDRWIARLARRVRRAPTDAAHSEGDMPGDDGTSSELVTMLMLRRVPLFADLEPEDLQRIAMVATDRDFPAGTALMREGDVTDELVVIAEGTVRVVQAAPDGSERFIRRYGAGDHIGELAVLRDRPRAATVIAEDDVRGLVIGGDGLRAILRERPEASMAMLATLAERISRQ